MLPKQTIQACEKEIAHCGRRAEQALKHGDHAASKAWSRRAFILAQCAHQPNVTGATPAASPKRIAAKDGAAGVGDFA